MNAPEVWLLMSDLVLDHQRRRAVSDELGISFGRARAIRRLARQPMSMGELAAALDIDPPNATVLVDDMEAQRLVRRRQHPSDRRAKIVEATRKGKDMARRAEEILGTPPPGLSALSPDDLESLRRILASLTRGGSEPDSAPPVSGAVGQGRQQPAPPPAHDPRPRPNSRPS